MKAMSKHQVFAVLLGALTCGCIHAPFMPPPGLVGVTKAPLSTEGNWQVGSKVGKSEAFCVLGLYTWGDCSLTGAAKNGSLKRIDYADYQYTNIIGIWQKLEVFAHGE